MKKETRIMTRQFKLMKLGYDFMGYNITNKKDLSFHHLIIPHRLCKEFHVGEGYLFWNGAILNQATSHDYLHLIEAKDFDRFLAITSEMIDENIKGRLDIDNIRKIHDVLSGFEREHDTDRGKRGKLLIKREYKNRKRF